MSSLKSLPFGFSGFVGCGQVEEKTGQHGKKGELQGRIVVHRKGKAKVQNLQVVFLSSADSLKEESGTIFGSQIKVFQTFLYYSCLMIRFSHTVLLNEF